MSHPASELLQPIITGVGNVSRRVFLLGIDGVGTLPQDVDLPHVGGLIRNGVYTYKARTVYPTLSYESWTSFLHGVSPRVHQTFTALRPAPVPNNSTFPSILRLASEREMLGVSIVNWPPMNTHLIESDLTTIKKFVTPDEFGIQRILTDFLRWHDPALALVVFDACDVAGHRHGYFSEGQRRCLLQVDEVIGRLLAEINRLPGENYIVVTTDHGGGGYEPHRHGSRHPKDITIFWSLTGPSIPRGIQIREEFSIVDTPAVVAAILGLEKPASWEGKVPAVIAKALRSANPPDG
jgi:hypothetical protein